jgi:hypothetical protein
MATRLTDADDLADVLKIQLSSLATLITEDGYSLVCDQTVQELGWSFPVTTPAKVLWMVKRGTRHAIELLRIASANKFKYKQVSLNQRFEHFQKMIEEFDKEFGEAFLTEISLFAGVNSFAIFGTKIDAGFSYGVDGEDETYDYDKYVNFSPMGGA